MRGADPGSKVSILLVDDQPANLLALEAVLAELGQDLVRARSGEEALARLGERDFAVVLLDVQMQGLDGFETAKLIRTRERTRRTPIIFLTAFDRDPKFPPEAAYALGAVDYLVKPLVPVILRAKVAGFIELFREAERAARAEAKVRQQLGHVLATVNDMFLMLDGELRYTYVNDRMVEASGIPREGLVGKRLREVFPDVADSLLERELRRALERRTAVHFEFYHASYDRWFENRAYPSEGGLILVATEITEAKKAEGARRHLAAIVESSDDAIVSTGLDGVITSWNKGAERLLGYAADEAIGRHVSMLMPADLPEDSARILEPIRRGDAVEHHETRRKRKDGTSIDVSLAVSPVRNAEGEVVGASKIARDITEKKRANERQRLLAEAGRILGSSLDYEATLADVCRLVVPGFADWCLLDLLSDDGVPRRIHVAHKDPAMVELAHEFRRRYPPRLDDTGGLMKVLRSGEPELIPEITDEMLARGARDEDHLRALRSVGLRSAMIVPITARGRTLGALTVVMADSSRRFGEADLGLARELASRAALAVENASLFAEAHEAIRVRDEALALHRGIEEKLTLLVEASGSLNASLDPRSVLDAVLALSRRLILADAYAVWRYRPESGRWGIELGSGLSEEYHRSTIAVVNATPAMPDSAVIAEDVYENRLLGDRAAAYDREGIRSLMSVPLRVHGGVIGTLVFYYRSPHRFSEVEVRAAAALANLAGSAISTTELNQELRDNDRRKDEFLAMLAHELRNPLSAISNAVRLARKTQAEDELEWSKEVIERQAGKLARLMDDLLDVSRITRGKIQLKKEPLGARRVLQAAIDAVRPLIDARGHELTVSTGPGTLRLEADPMRLEQILINLLTNAAKYTESGGHIWASAERRDSAVVFTVRDDGIGIPPESLPTMFELFAQGERSIARSEGGLGIGLTLVRKLAEMHGGSVSAQSEGPGEGSTFTVRLPAAEEESRAEAVPPPEVERGARRSRILVVDDNADAARGIARLLKLLGHEVVTAEDGPSGMEAARTLRPDVILLDIGLPGMSGYEVASRLRREECGKDVLIIAISGYGQEEDRRRSREAGFDYHLVKPIDHDALVTLLSR
jgi:PAS domain S-box-containing protein